MCLWLDARFVGMRVVHGWTTTARRCNLMVTGPYVPIYHANVPVYSMEKGWGASSCRVVVARSLQDRAGADFDFKVQTPEAEPQRSAPLRPALG